MSNKLGIDSIKKSVAFAVDFGLKVADSLEDGKITFWESLGFVSNLKDIPEIVETLPQIKAEVKELSSEETSELLLYIKERFDFKGSDVEEKVNASISFLESSAILIETLKK